MDMKIVFYLKLEKHKMEPTYNITLNCIDCGNWSCRIGDIIFQHENDGCIREVPESVYLNYYHLINEVWPFCNKNNYYDDVINACNDVYKCKIVGKNGKHFTPKILIDDYS